MCRTKRQTHQMPFLYMCISTICGVVDTSLVTLSKLFHAVSLMLWGVPALSPCTYTTSTSLMTLQAIKGEPSVLTWAVNTKVGPVGSSRNTRTPAQHRVVVSSGVVITGGMVILGGTAGERGRGRESGMEC